MNNTDKIYLDIDDEELINKIERENFLLSGLMEILTNFTFKNQYDIDDNRYEDILNNYLKQYIKFQLIFNDICNFYINKNKIKNTDYNYKEIDYNNKKIILYNK